MVQNFSGDTVFDEILSKRTDSDLSIGGSNRDRLRTDSLFKREPNTVQLYDKLNRNDYMFAGEMTSFMVLSGVFTFMNLSQFKLSGLDLLLYTIFVGLGSLAISHLTFKFIKHIIFKRKRYSQKHEVFMLHDYYVSYLNEIIEFEDKRLVRRYRFIDVSHSTSKSLNFTFDYPSKVKKVHRKKPEGLSTDELAIVNACPDEYLGVEVLSKHIVDILDTLSVLEEEERQKEYQKTYDAYRKANQTYVETSDISSLKEVERNLQSIIHNHQQNIKKRSDNNG